MARAGSGQCACGRPSQARAVSPRVGDVLPASVKPPVRGGQAAGQPVPQHPTPHASPTDADGTVSIVRVPVQPAQ